MSAPIEISVATEADEASWDAYVLGKPEAFGYHEWAWRSVFQRAFGHQNWYLIARARDQIVGVLPMVEIRSLLFGRTLTSLPFVNFAGVLANTDEVAKALIDRAGALARERRSRHVELRHVEQRFPNLPCKQHKVTMRLSLGESAEALWNRIDRKARNQVRKAQKSDLSVARGGSELVGDFYKVFARNMRDLGTPVYSRRLFDEVTTAFPDRARIIVVRQGQLPIAAGLTFQTRGMVEIPWASSIRDFNSLCPNHLLYWHALESAANEGLAVFDFGRSTPGEGTFKFKEQWGAEPVPLHWEYWLPAGDAMPDASPKNPKYQLMIETWKHLPMWAANLAGPRIVRAIP